MSLDSQKRSELEQLINDPTTSAWDAVRKAKQSRDMGLIEAAYKREFEQRLEGRKGPNLGNAVEAGTIAYFLNNPSLIQRAEEEIKRSSKVRGDKPASYFIEEAKTKGQKLRSKLERDSKKEPIFDDTLFTYEEYVTSDSLNLRAESLRFALELGDTKLVERTSRATYELLRNKDPELPENPNNDQMFVALYNYNQDPVLGYNNNDPRLARLAAQLAKIMGRKDLEEEAHKQVILCCFSHEHLMRYGETYANENEMGEFLGFLKTRYSAQFERIREINKLRNAALFQELGKDIVSLNLVMHGLDTQEKVLGNIKSPKQDRYRR